MSTADLSFEKSLIENVMKLLNERGGVAVYDRYCNDRDYGSSSYYSACIRDIIAHMPDSKRELKNARVLSEFESDVRYYCNYYLHSIDEAISKQKKQ